MQVVEEYIRQVEGQSTRQDRPLVTLTYAQSIDGSIARDRGEALALSGLATMKITHRLRALHDGILVGIGTVLADDPKLTVRLVDGANPQPIILDSNLRIPTNARLLTNQNRPWIFASPTASQISQKILEQHKCHVMRMNVSKNGNIPLSNILHFLNSKGIKRLMVEGGSAVIGSFLNSGFVDVVVITIAPLFVGGFKAVESLIESKGSASNFPKISPLFVEKVDEDILIWGGVRSKTP